MAVPKLMDVKSTHQDLSVGYADFHHSDVFKKRSGSRIPITYMPARAGLNQIRSASPVLIYTAGYRLYLAGHQSLVRHVAGTLGITLTCGVSPADIKTHRRESPW